MLVSTAVSAAIWIDAFPHVAGLFVFIKLRPSKMVSAAFAPM